MLGFVDESGDTGFRFDRNSSPFFVVTLVLLQNEEEADRVRVCIDELKLRLGKPAMEFHFTDTSDSSRQKFFNAVRTSDFKVFALVCDKSRLQSLKGKHEDFLMASFGTALERARDAGLLDAANIKYDEAGGNAFQKKLSSTLMAKVNGTEAGRYIKRCEPQASKGNNLIQLVDMVCGAVARPYNKPHRQDADYLAIIEHRVDSVLNWP